MSGRDNATPAIGRVLGALLFLNLLMALPGVVVGVLLTQHEKWETWAALLSALVVYVPAVTLSVGGLIRGTAATEPKP